MKDAVKKNLLRAFGTIISIAQDAEGRIVRGELTCINNDHQSIAWALKRIADANTEAMDHIGKAIRETVT